MQFRMGFVGVVVVFGFLLVSMIAAAAPVVSNVNAAQRTDGSGMVDIYYDLSGGVGTITVTLEVSNDGCATWAITPQAQHLSGNIGSVTNGTGKHIIWDMGSDLPSVIANDQAVGSEDEPLEGEEVEGEGNTWYLTIERHRKYLLVSKRNLKPLSLHPQPNRLPLLGTGYAKKFPKRAAKALMSRKQETQIST